MIKLISSIQNIPSILNALNPSNDVECMSSYNICKRKKKALSTYSKRLIRAERIKMVVQHLDRDRYCVTTEDRNYFAHNVVHEIANIDILFLGSRKVNKVTTLHKPAKKKVTV